MLDFLIIFSYSLWMVNKADKLKKAAAKENQDQCDSIKELTTFSEVGKTITSSFDLNEILNSVMETIGKYFDLKNRSILLLDHDKGELNYELVVGEDSEKISKLRPKLDASISGYVAKSGKPLLVPDITKDKRFAKYKDSFYGFVDGPLMCVPIATKGKTLGVIELYNIRIENFENPRNLLLLKTLADYTAIAIENALLFNRVQDLTTDGLCVNIGPIKRSELINSDEAFLTNSIIEIAPLVKIDSQRVALGLPGEITKRIQRLYQESKGVK